MPTLTKQIPRPVALFFIKALVLFIAWKLAYLSFLQPKRVLDGPLTRLVGHSTGQVLDMTARRPDGYSVTMVMDTVYMEGRAFRSPAVDIYRNDQRTLRVADACNGLELMVLYLGFLICFPALLRKKLEFALAGLILIYFLNIIRCVALVEIFIHYNKYVDVSHHFVFTFIVYAFIFLLWYFFTKNLRLNGRPS